MLISRVWNNLHQVLSNVDDMKIKEPKEHQKSQVTEGGDP